MSTDKDALEELRSVSKMDEAHMFQHYLYFPVERTSREVAAILNKRGFIVEVRLGADGTNWLVLAKNEMLPTDVKVAEARAILEQIATEKDGEYDGWEAEVRMKNKDTTEKKKGVGDS
jgi:hypothetical protein